MVTRKVKLAGKQRKQLIQFIADPLELWLKVFMKQTFPEPIDREAQDITAEAVAQAVAAVLSQEALEQMALDIIERKNK